MTCLQCLCSAFRLGRMCDVSLKSGDTELSAHFLVLSSSSTYFDDLFDKRQGSSQDIIINEIDGETLVKVVEFLYGDEEFIINEGNVEVR